MDVAISNILAVFSFIFGASIASFLNVVIWRVPRGESIVRPASHCPKCGALIKWYQNLPIIAWLALRGRCAACKAPISPRYLLVETIGGLLFLGAFFKFGFSIDTLITWVWMALMIVGSFIDFDHKLLPDFVTVGGMMLGVAYGALDTIGNMKGCGILGWPVTWSLIGLVFGFGMLWLVRFLGSKAFGREAMGMGDVFLMGAVGAMHGPVAALFTLIFSSLFGSIIGVSAIILSKTKLGRFTEIPYGPYICMGDLLWIFAGPQILKLYLAALR